MASVSLFYYVFAAHVRSQYLGDPDRAVFVEIVLKERNQHSRRCNDGVVERMRKIFSAFSVDANFQAVL